MKPIAILPIVFLIFIISIGVIVWSGMFDELFTLTPASPSLNGSFQIAKIGTVVFDQLISPIPVILAVLFVALIGLIAIGLVRKTRM